MIFEDLAPYVIAEIGANHNGEIALAIKLIEAAKEAGAVALNFKVGLRILFSRKKLR